MIERTRRQVIVEGAAAVTAAALPDVANAQSNSAETAQLAAQLASIRTHFSGTDPAKGIHALSPDLADDRITLARYASELLNNNKRDIATLWTYFRGQEWPPELKQGIFESSKKAILKEQRREPTPANIASIRDEEVLPWIDKWVETAPTKVRRLSAVAGLAGEEHISEEQIRTAQQRAPAYIAQIVAFVEDGLKKNPSGTSAAATAIIKIMGTLRIQGTRRGR